MAKVSFPDIDKLFEKRPKGMAETVTGTQPPKKGKQTKKKTVKKSKK